MEEPQQLLALTNWLSTNLDSIWTYMLLWARFTVLMNLIPGIGQGAQGQYVRQAGVMFMALAALSSSQVSPMPDSIVLLIVMLFSEVVLGGALGLMPHLVIAGVQTAGMLSSTTMGLGAGQLFDPSLGVSITSLARIMADLAIIFFLTLGGHYWLIYIASGIGSDLIPGMFFLSLQGVDEFIQQSGRIFLGGALISAPVIVALLLTQFVMGLVTKAVPTVNIFIVSFPITIGVGLVLTALSLGDVMIFVEREFRQLEPAILRLIDS